MLLIPVCHALCGKTLQTPDLPGQNQFSPKVLTTQSRDVHTSPNIETIPLHPASARDAIAPEAKATPKCNVCQYLFAMISLDWLCKHQTKVFTLLSVETKFLQSQPHAPISFLAVKCCLCEASLLTAAEIPQRQSLRHENLFLQALQHPQNENNS